MAKKNEEVYQHQAWNQFLSSYKPALSKSDCEEALTTEQVLMKLNAIVYDDFFSESELYYHMNEAGFRTVALSGTDTVVWLIRTNTLPVSLN